MKPLYFALLPALLLASCNEDDAPGPQTVTKIAASQIAANTNDRALPIEFNTRQISDADTDETSLPDSVN